MYEFFSSHLGESLAATIVVGFLIAVVIDALKGQR